MPEPGLSLGLAANTGHVAFLRSIAAADRQRTAEHLPVTYLSRTKLPSRMRKPFGEAKIEAVVESSGHSVVWPETLGISDQIELFNACPRLAGFIGSQFHTMVFRREALPLNVTYLCNELPNVNFLHIDMLCPGKRRYINASRFEPLFKFGTRSPFRIDFERALFGLERLGVSVPVSAALALGDTPEDVAAYAHQWFSSFFTHKVFGQASIAMKIGGPDVAGKKLDDQLRVLARRLTQRDPFIAHEMMRAFDETAGTFAAIPAPLRDVARTRLQQISDRLTGAGDAA